MVIEHQLRYIDLGDHTMRHSTKITALIASFSLAAIALAGCAGAADAPVPEAAPEETISVEAPVDAPAEATFNNSVLTTEDVTIAITDTRVIQVGEPGNEYGDVPVIAFWYDVTNNGADRDVTPSDFIFYFNAFQDNDPNAENELNVGSLPDDQFLDSQLENIKVGGTVSNAVAYELTDTTTPVTLVASTDLGQTEIGSMTVTIG